MSLLITSLKLALKEPDFFSEVLLKAATYDSECEVVIYTNARAVSGWLEWNLEITRQNGRKGLIGCIQRNVGREIEFCT